MKLKLKITRYTTESELVHLGNFFTALGMNRGAHVFAPPPDAAELHEPEFFVVVPPTGTTPQELRTGEIGTIDSGINILTGKPEPKRRRRTKAEIEAEAHASQGAPLPEQEGPIEPGEPGNEQAAGTDQPAPTPTAPETTSGAAEAPATDSPSERPAPTPVSLNIKATAVAKRIGPEKIKAKINELGGKLISTLTPEALIEFDAWLDAQ